MNWLRTALSTAVALLFVSAARGEDDTREKIIASARSKVVALRVEGEKFPFAEFPDGQPPIYGTGFVVATSSAGGGRVRILTAGHVVGKDNMWVKHPYGVSRSVFPMVLDEWGRSQREGFRGVVVHPSVDIAQVVGGRNANPFELAANGYTVGRKYYVVSWGLDPQGQPPEEPYLKEVRSIDTARASPAVPKGLGLVEILPGQDYSDFKHSESGSPVIDSDGRVVALVIQERRNLRGNTASQAIVLPFSMVEDWLKTVHDKPVKEPPAIRLGENAPTPSTVLATASQSADPEDQAALDMFRGTCVFLGKYSKRNVAAGTEDAYRDAPFGPEILRKVIGEFDARAPREVDDEQSSLSRIPISQLVVAISGPNEVNIRSQCPTLVSKPKREKPWERVAYYGPVVAVANSNYKFNLSRVHRQAYLDDYFYWGTVDSISRASDPEVIASSGNWELQRHDYAGTGYSALAQINTGNVGSLKVAWSFSTGVLRGHEGSPLVIGNMMYLHTPFPNIVYALNLDDENKIVWKYEPKQDPSVIPVMCCDTVNRGLQYADGKLFLHQADTALVALDAKSGKEVWKAVNGDPKRGETGTGAALVVGDVVMIGVSGAEFGVRGSLTAYDVNTGKLRWRAYSVGPDTDILFNPEKTTSLGKPVGKDSSLKTWTGDQWKLGGGTAWGWYTWDPMLNLVYYGTGNPSTWNPAQRAGPGGKALDQKWTTSIIARNPQTGEAAWAYQMTPFDEWGFDGVNEMILVDDMHVKGSKHNVLVHFDRNGFAYTVDRKSGLPLVAEKFNPAVNWATGVDLDPNSSSFGRPAVVASKSPFLNGENVNTEYVCPATLGTKNQEPAAYSPLTRLFYVPTNNVCMDFEPFAVRYAVGQPYVGATLSMYPPRGEHHSGSLIAWDASTGKIVWSNKEQFSVWSGVLTTAGGIACYGTLEGYLKCVDQATGTELYKHRTSSGIIGNVFTYRHRGKQYIGALSGVGGWGGIGLAAGLDKPTDGLGAVGGYGGLNSYTALGGVLTVWELGSPP